MTDMKSLRFRKVEINPARIPPQQEAARKFIALMRMREVRVATYLNELIHRNQPSERQRIEAEPLNPSPVDALEMELTVE